MIDYAPPTLRRPADFYTPGQLRQGAARGGVLELRYRVHLYADDAVAAAKTHAKRVAALRKLSIRANARMLKEFSTSSGTAIVSTAKHVTDGKKYTVRVGGSVGYARFTVKGKKIVVTVKVPARP